MKTKLQISVPLVWQYLLDDEIQNADLTSETVPVLSRTPYQHDCRTIEHLLDDDKAILLQLVSDDENYWIQAVLRIGEDEFETVFLTSEVEHFFVFDRSKNRYDISVIWEQST